MTSVDVGLVKAVSAPKQGRSKQSYERMLSAAEQLLVERGHEDFTLNEVSKLGKVSIGSIYNRFESKDDLLHAVQLRVLHKVDAIMEARLREACERASSLDELIVGLIEGFALTLRESADVMRPLMLRAAKDELVATTGKQSYSTTATQICEALLAYREDIRHPDPEMAVGISFRMIYAAIARYLGLGSTSTAMWEGDWEDLKINLARMIAAFLQTRPRF